MLKYDFESILERLKKRTINKLDKEGTNTDILLFSSNAAFLEAAAEELADNIMYDEFLSREVVWGTTQGYNSMAQQALFYNYKPHRKRGATGVIKVSADKDFSNSWSANITIPQFTKFSGGGLNFVNTREGFLKNSEYFLNLDIVQSTVQEEKFTINPSAFPTLSYARLSIEKENVENSFLEVWVNGEKYTEIDHIRLASENDKVYTVNNLLNFKGIEIRFGNGTFGTRLDYNSTVLVKYLETKGENGNILSSGIITKIEGTILDENGTKVDLFCTNEDPVMGGSNVEEVEDIRARAPKSFKTGSRAISVADYTSLIYDTGEVHKLVVWGEKELNEDLGQKPGTYIDYAENLIYISGITIDHSTGFGIALRKSAEDAIRKALNDKKGATDILQFVPSEIVYVTFNIDAYIKGALYTPNQIKQFIYDELKETYSLKRAEYKKSLYFSDYYRKIDSITGIDHHRTTLSFSQFYYFYSMYQFTANLNLGNIKKGSVVIKIRNKANNLNDWKTIAVDDSNGNLVGVPVDDSDPSLGNYEVPGSTINYDTGFIGDVLVTNGLKEPFLTYDIKIDFELDEKEKGDLVLTKRQQIIAFLHDDVTIHVMGVV